MANLVFREGFDSYNGVSSASVGMASKWTIGVAGGLVTGRFGTGQAMRLNGGNTNNHTTPPFSSNVTTFTFEGGMRVTAGGSSTSLAFREGSSITHVDLVFNVGGSITARRNGTSLGSSAGTAFVVNQWHTFQCEIVIDDTVGRVTIYIDGTQVLNLTDVDTRNGNSGYVSRLFFDGSAGIDWDDIYVQDTGTRLTNPLRCETLLPNADGGTLNLVPSTGTSHFAVVDEALASASDYLQGTNINIKYTFFWGASNSMN